MRSFGFRRHDLTVRHQISATETAEAKSEFTVGWVPELFLASSNAGTLEAGFGTRLLDIPAPLL